MRSPFLSIVTPIKNGARFLPQCLASIEPIREAGFSLEHIVVDGGSTDGTLEILAGRRDVRVFAEPGMPADAAVFAGVRHGHAGWVMLLMSDDELTPFFADLLRAVAAAGDTIDIALASARLFVEPPDGVAGEPGQALPSPASVWEILHRYPGLNSAIVSRQLWRRAKLFPGLGLVNDRLLMLEFLAGSRSALIWDKAVVAMRVHDRSNTLSAGRDVRRLKHEHNHLTLSLLRANAGRPGEALFAAAAWRAALSLLKESFRKSSGSLSSWPRWPAVASLRLLPAGLRRRHRRYLAAGPRPRPMMAPVDLQDIRIPTSAAGDPV